MKNCNFLMRRWRTPYESHFDWWNWLVWNHWKYDYRYFSYKSAIYDKTKK